jgi:hypothetical protein
MKNKKEEVKSTPNVVGYDIIPASVDTLNAYETLGVKFINNKRDLWYTRSNIDGIQRYFYPDRTIYKLLPGVVSTSIPHESLDMYLDYSPLGNPELFKKCGYRYMMVSAPHMNFLKTPLRNNHLQIFSDSGGFQMKTGVSDFIDPDKLIDFYNYSVDIGIGLDVPMNPLLYPTHLARMAHMSHRLGVYMKSKLKIKLYDLNHGMDIKDRKIFLEVSDKYEPLDGIAIAGASSNARGEYKHAEHLVNGVVSIAYTLTYVKDRYKTAHMLGVTTTFYMFIFSLMTKSGFFPHITSDSSTYAQAGMMNTYLSSYDKKLIVRPTLPKSNIEYRTTCQCPVCVMVGYKHALFICGKATMVHGMYHFAYVKSLVEDLAQQYLDGTIKIKDLIPLVSPSCFSTAHFTNIMKFLDDLFSKGFKIAYKNNQDFIRLMAGGSRRKSLFSSMSVKSKIPAEEESTVNRILSSYESWMDSRGF